MFAFENLDAKTRQHMAHEVDEAIKTSQLYFSKRFSLIGQAQYPQLLREAVASGTEATLAAALKEHGCFNTHEKQHTITKRVPKNAHITFAEGEFNSFYMRAICRRAISEGHMVEVYRAKQSDAPRQDSTLIEGEQHAPARALLLLKNSQDGSQRGPGMPAGSNSGLSLRLTSESIR